MGKLKNQTGFGTVELIFFIVILAAIGTVGWMVHKNMSTSTVASKTAATTTKTVAAAAVAKPITETDALTGGLSISYPLTKANANVIWWSNNGDTPTTATSSSSVDYLSVSDKQILQFLSNIPFDVVQPVCGDDTLDTVAIQMGVYDPSTNTLTLHNQYENCLASFANATGNKYQAQAVQVTAAATADLQAWGKSVTVIKSN